MGFLLNISSISGKHAISSYATEGFFLHISKCFMWLRQRGLHQTESKSKSSPVSFILWFSRCGAQKSAEESEVEKKRAIIKAAHVSLRCTENTSVAQVRTQVTWRRNRGVKEASFLSWERVNKWWRAWSVCARLACGSVFTRWKCWSFRTAFIRIRDGLKEHAPSASAPLTQIPKHLLN